MLIYIYLKLATALDTCIQNRSCTQAEHVHTNTHAQIMHPGLHVVDVLLYTHNMCIPTHMRMHALTSRLTHNDMNEYGVIVIVIVLLIDRLAEGHGQKVRSGALSEAYVFKGLGYK